MITGQEQAQTIAKAKSFYEMSNALNPDRHYNVHIKDLLTLVDTQAQQIEAMQKQLNSYSLLMDTAKSLMQKQYTWSEIMQEWSRRCRPIGGFNSVAETVESKAAFREACRFLGAIKEPEKT